MCDLLFFVRDIYIHEYLCKELLLKYTVLLDTLHVISCYARVFMTSVWLSCWLWMKIWHLLWLRNCHLVIWGKLSFSFEGKDLPICRSAHTHICLHTHIHTRLLVNNVVGYRASCCVRKGSWRMNVVEEKGEFSPFTLWNFLFRYNPRNFHQHILLPKCHLSYNYLFSMTCNGQFVFYYNFFGQKWHVEKL